MNKKTLIIIGVVILVIGIILVINGDSKNHTLEGALMRLGGSAPGTDEMIGGVIVGLIGIISIITGALKKE
ncbi:MAG: hypothetical protein K9N06_04195 [Candidatus Cloacimonetes bacterium]|nr:hypothetical protein [Candidatus Cloacimonadota bacterium]